MRYSPPRCLAVDVDGTLVERGTPNPAVVDLIRERAAQGWDVVIWSMRGRAYAQAAATLAGVQEVAVCISKPGIVVDDQGLAWLGRVQVVRMGRG